MSEFVVTNEEKEEEVGATLIKEEKKKKIALLFLLSYHHILHQENVWKEWIASFPDPSLINVYFHVDDPNKVSSSWIKSRILPPNLLQKTSYYHICPALFALLRFSLMHDVQNTWFVFLTDTCVPIVAASQFWDRFQQYSDFSVLRHSPPWWNVNFHRRANLRLIPADLRFGHDPWFLLTRVDVFSICHTLQLAYHRQEYNQSKQQQLVRLIQTVLSGGLANESIFALLLQIGNGRKHVISASTHYANFARSKSTTSPYLYQNTESDIAYFQSDIKYIHHQRHQPNNSFLFLFFFRKIHSSFPSFLLFQNMTLTKEKKNKCSCLTCMKYMKYMKN